MKLSDIKISETFAATMPKSEKLNACREHWNSTHQQDRDIVVNKNKKVSLITKDVCSVFLRLSKFIMLPSSCLLQNLWHLITIAVHIVSSED